MRDVYEYLAEEVTALDEILSGLERDRKKALVLDTTGSVIYTGNHLMYRLRKLMKVVYLAASDAEQEKLFGRGGLRRRELPRFPATI